jgi:hypothetical protein
VVAPPPRFNAKEALMSDSADRRLRRLEDIEEIRRLKLRYFDACDGGFDGIPSHVPDQIAGTFAEDGEWDGGPFGKRAGPDAIADFYREVPQALAFTVLSEPAIDIDGDRATGRWNLIVYSQHGDAARLTGGVHHDEYVRTPGGWRIARTRYASAIRMTSPSPWLQGSEGQ